MSITWVRLVDGSETKIRIHPSFVEEAAANDEVIQDVNGKHIRMIDVDLFAPAKDKDESTAEDT